MGSTKAGYAVWYMAIAFSWKVRSQFHCHPQTTPPLALRSQLEHFIFEVTDSYITPSSIQSFVWCGGKIRPQPILPAHTVYTVTETSLQLTLATVDENLSSSSCCSVVNYTLLVVLVF